ncbi:MAG: DUF3037 domain-containing protein [Terracidiphilus sp.]|nr:DUF3037 domain-containing protein [Terracidiphilus sp.]
MAASFSYAVFRYVKDARRDLTVPVGVALWSDDAQFVRVRLVENEDKTRNINKADDIPYINLVCRKVSGWLKERELPYQDREMSPYTDDWWRHVRNLLIHRVRISEPLSIDCHDPSAELEPLFASIVVAESSKRTTHRIDSILKSALGEQVAGKFHRGPIEGYAGKPVQVMRVYRGEDADVVLDAVNLAAEDAPQQADCLVGKLRRARLNGHGPVRRARPLLALVGYVSSPNGLNGEAYLKQWIEQDGEAQAFDLRREQQKLRDAAEKAMGDASSSLFRSTPQ